MSYSTDAVAVGKTPLEIVEIEAVVNIDASVSSGYRTKATTSSGDSFTSGIRKYRFISEHFALTGDPAAKALAISQASWTAEESETFTYPTLVRVSHRPTKVPFQEGFGSRAQISIELRDHSDNDVYTDPFYRTRSYRAVDQGTFWGKWIRRNKFYPGWKLNYYVGYQDENGAINLSNFQKHVFFLDSILGVGEPTVTLSGKDVFKVASDERATVPKRTTGKLLADISDSDTTLLLSPSGVGSQYALEGKIALNDEIIAYSRTGDAMSLTRAQNGTDAAAHTAGDSIQDCYVVDGAPPAYVLWDMLTNYTNSNIQSNWITYADWVDEIETYIGDIRFSHVQTEPLKIVQAIKEITQVLFARMFWDSVNQKIVLEVDKPVVSADFSFSDYNYILERSVAVTDSPEDWVTQAFVYYGLRTPTSRTDEDKSFQVVEGIIVDSAQAGDELGDVRVREIRSRWVDKDQSTYMSQLVNRIVNRYNDLLRRVRFSVDISQAPRLNQSIQVTTRGIQDVDGSGPATVVRAETIELRHLTQECIIHALEAKYRQRYFIIAEDEDEALTYDVATESEQGAMGFIADSNETVPTAGDEGYAIF